MKKLETLKTVQLIIFIALAGACFYLIIVQSNVYHLIAESDELKLVCGLLWGCLFVSFLFVFIDFSLYSKQKKDMKALDYAVHSDPLAKIANRSGVDEVIDKYMEKDLPENAAVIMILLTSLYDINKNNSRTEGNKLIRSFSIILKLASVNTCFVGRNGGNVFLAIFEDTTKENIEFFLDRVETKATEHNDEQPNMPIHFQCGLAFHETGVKDISELISLANKRAKDSERWPNKSISLESKLSIPTEPEKTQEIKETEVKEEIVNNPVVEEVEPKENLETEEISGAEMVTEIEETSETGTVTEIEDASEKDKVSDIEESDFDTTDPHDSDDSYYDDYKDYDDLEDYDDYKDFDDVEDYEEVGSIE